MDNILLIVFMAAKKYADISSDVLKRFDIATKILMIISSYFIIDFLLSKKSKKYPVETRISLTLVLFGFVFYFLHQYFLSHMLYMFTLFAIILLGKNMPDIFKKLAILALLLHVYCTSVYNFCYLTYFQTKTTKINMVKSDIFMEFLLYFIIGQYILWIANVEPGPRIHFINTRILYISTAIFLYETIAYFVPTLPFILLNEKIKKH